jgi:hypothetical protein
MIYFHSNSLAGDDHAAANAVAQMKNELFK